MTLDLDALEALAQAADPDSYAILFRQANLDFLRAFDPPTTLALIQAVRDGHRHIAALERGLMAIDRTGAQVALLTACEAALDWFDEMTEACEPGCDCTHDKLRAAVRLEAVERAANVVPLATLREDGKPLMYRAEGSTGEMP